MKRGKVDGVGVGERERGEEDDEMQSCFQEAARAASFSDRAMLMGLSGNVTLSPQHGNGTIDQPRLFHLAEFLPLGPRLCTHPCTFIVHEYQMALFFLSSSSSRIYPEGFYISHLPLF